MLPCRPQSESCLVGLPRAVSQTFGIIVLTAFTRHSRQSEGRKPRGAKHVRSASGGVFFRCSLRVLCCATPPSCETPGGPARERQAVALDGPSSLCLSFFLSQFLVHACYVGGGASVCGVDVIAVGGFRMGLRYVMLRTGLGARVFWMSACVRGPWRPIQCSLFGHGTVCRQPPTEPFSDVLGVPFGSGCAESSNARLCRHSPDSP